MNWTFIDLNILTDLDTGFTIRLLDGTWQEPQSISYDQAHFTPLEQARYLRLGLEFARGRWSRNHCLH
jgi:hypothetical protein